MRRDPEATYSGAAAGQCSGCLGRCSRGIGRRGWYWPDPLRRTAVLLDPPAGCDVSGWPLVMASDGSFYLKPDAGLILASPADEHPSQACDAQPEELDIAYAVHYAQQALQQCGRSSTAGPAWQFCCRPYPVIGFCPEFGRIFWVAGQVVMVSRQHPPRRGWRPLSCWAAVCRSTSNRQAFDPAWVSRVDSRQMAPHNAGQLA